MSMVERITSLVTGEERTDERPVGTVHVVDPSPLNWLYITYNTVEELVRMDPDGAIVPAAMKSYSWKDDLTLEVELRPENRFQDGEALTARSVKRGFDESMRWAAPHPPGTHFNILPGTTCEITGEHSVRFHLPAPDGPMLGKLRAMHIMSTRFWDEIGFGYERNGTGEGHW